MNDPSQTHPASMHDDYRVATGRDVAALHDPRPACIIGACSDAGEVGFATVMWVTPLSHSPSMVAFALRAKSHTMGIIRETGRFSISIPPADEEGVRLVEFCGTTTGRATDKGAAVAHQLVSVCPLSEKNPAEAAQPPANLAMPLTASIADATRDDESSPHANANLVPVLSHCYSWEVGRIDSIQPAGDHLLAIGTITHAETRATRDKRGQLVPKSSLLCVQHGHYASCMPI